MNNRPPNCEAQRDRGTDTIVCTKCGMQWDVSDDDPPGCKPINGTPVSYEQAEGRRHRQNKTKGRNAFKQILERLRS